MDVLKEELESEKRRREDLTRETKTNPNPNPNWRRREDLTRETLELSMQNTSKTLGVDLLQRSISEKQVKDEEAQVALMEHLHVLTCTYVSGSVDGAPPTERGF